MHCKLALIVLTGFLPLIALGQATSMNPSASDEWQQLVAPPTLDIATNQEPRTLRFKVTCRSGAVVTLDQAMLVERGPQKAGSNPQSTGVTAPPTLRLDMPEGGTVSLPWDKIEKITVSDRAPARKTYPIEVTLKNEKQTKVGKTYGYDNTIIGQSDDGEFSIPLMDVLEIIVLPPSEEK